jgi:CHAD domain-containing protein
MAEVGERSYDLAPGAIAEDLATVLLPLGRLLPIGGQAGVKVGYLTYYDTPELALTKAALRLWSGQGAIDAGWQIEMPITPSEQPARYLFPLRSSEEIPEDVRTLVARFADPLGLRPVVRLRRARTSFDLVGATSEVLAKLTDDRVVAIRELDDMVFIWREIGVTEARAGPGVGEELAEALVGTGAQASSPMSRLERVLEGSDLGAAHQAEPVVARLRGQLGALVRLEAAAREGDEEAVHQMRVATRRLRACMSVYGEAFDKNALTQPRDALERLSGYLGKARDAAVLAARLERDLAALPAEVVLGPVRAVVRAYGARETAGALRSLVAYFDSSEHSASLEHLARFVADPPLLLRRRSRSWYRSRLDEAGGRVARLVASAAVATDNDREEALHAVRKAAKRARYGAETAVPVLGKEALRRARAYEAIQEVLGDHHDALAARRFFREEGARAGVRAGENGFTYGLLYAREDALVAAAEHRFQRRWKKLAARSA